MLSNSSRVNINVALDEMGRYDYFCAYNYNPIHPNRNTIAKISYAVVAVELGAYLDDQGITHIRDRPYHPRNTGQ